MAPVTRASSTFSLDGFIPSGRQIRRGDRTAYAPSESRSEDSRDASMNDAGDRSLDPSDEGELAPLRLLDPDDYQNALHPLRDAADRVGREVERFAEQLDRLNPRLSTNSIDDRVDDTIALVTGYHEIAKAAVSRLQRSHAQDRQRLITSRWKRDIGTFLGDGDSGDVPIEDDASHDESSNATRVADLQYWEQEEQTWRLFRELIEIRSRRPNDEADTEETYRYSSEEKLWDRFLVEDHLARERNAVLTWLKQNAESSRGNIDDIVQHMTGDEERGTWTQGWLYTKEAIKAQKRMRVWNRPLDPKDPGLAASLLNSDRTEALVTQLDPDAVTRQERVLEKQDEFSERALWLACWEMLRRGKTWVEIRDWCKERNEGWRSVSLRGGIFAWDHAIDGEVKAGPGSARQKLEAHGAGSEYSQITGNRSRGIWRRMCYALARKGGLDDYERAVYGVLSGDVDSVEKVCHSWDDYVFAHYNSLVQSQFENFMQKRYPDRIPAAIGQKFPTFDAVQSHGDPASVGRRLVERLNTQPVTCVEASRPIKTIQGVFIGDSFGDFIYQQGLMLSKAANVTGQSRVIPVSEKRLDDRNKTTYIEATDYNALRILTHMLFALQDLGLKIPSEHQHFVDNVVVAYMDFLRLAGKLLMLPLYASRLHKERQAYALGRTLLDDNATAQRSQLVGLMYGLEIDVLKVVEAHLDFLLEDHPTMVPENFITSSNILFGRFTGKEVRKIQEGFIGDFVSRATDSLISGFEWYLLVSGHWAETFTAGAELYRRFYLLGDLPGAREILRRVPSSHISLSKTEDILGKQIDVKSYAEEDQDLEDETITLRHNSRMTKVERQQAAEQRRRKEKAEELRVKCRVLLKQAYLFICLEELTYALITLEAWQAVSLQEAPKSDRAAHRRWRDELEAACTVVSRAMEPLLRGWLMDVDEANLEWTSRVRSLYLPDVILAYNSCLHFTGHVASAETLLQCMELSTVIAESDSDLLPCFVESGRLKELVGSFAMTSKGILVAGGQAKKRGATRSRKKDRGMGQGETLTVWEVRP